MQRVTDLPVRDLLPVQPEPGLGGWPAHDKAERGCLPPEPRVVGHHPHVLAGAGGPARRDLVHARGRVGYLEHRQAPHLPDDVARVRVIGELDRYRPALVDGVLDLRHDLIVGEIGQVGERALGYAHDCS